MPPQKYIYEICVKCYGDGKVVDYVDGTPREVVACDACKGTGKVLWGYIYSQLDEE